LVVVVERVELPPEFRAVTVRRAHRARSIPTANPQPTPRRQKR